MGIAGSPWVEISRARPESVKYVAQYIELYGASTSLSLVEALVPKLTVSTEKQDTIID